MKTLEQHLLLYLIKYILTGALKSDCHYPKKKNYICFKDSPSKITKNAFYFILKSLFVLKICKFLF